jgi:hypothetical protein
MRAALLVTGLAACVTAQEVTVAPTQTAHSVTSAEIEPPPAAPREEARIPSVELAPDLAQKIDSGIPVDVVLEAEVSPGAHVEVGRCRVTFDLWDEVYVMRRAQQTDTSNHDELEDALRACASLEGRAVSALTVHERAKWER